MKPTKPFNPSWRMLAALLTLRNCCYWQLVQGAPVGNEKSKKRVKIPVSQHLTPQSLLDLIEAETARRKAQAA
jgi:hypothetical protein